MNFQALEWLVQSIISQYSCDSCRNRVQKADIDIESIEGNSITVGIHCMHCQKTSYIRSEVVSIDLTKYLSKEQLELVKSTIEAEKWPSISDEEIIDIHKHLNKNNCSVQDFFA